MKIHSTNNIWILLLFDRYLFYSPNLESNVGPHILLSHYVRYGDNYEAPEFLIKLNICIFLMGSLEKPVRKQ